MQPDSVEVPQVIEFNGVSYRLMGGKKRYYLSQSNTNAGRKRPKGLHVAIWEFHNGRSVPRGHDIHHKDGNNFNNEPDNLECLSRRKHRAEHPVADMPRQLAHLEKIRPLAAPWHSSPEGRAWHSKVASQPRVLVDCSCAQCGKVFQSKHSTARFCSEYCGYKFRKSTGLYDVTRVCVMCGITFKTTKGCNPSQIPVTCGKSCGVRLGKQRRLQHNG